jgi:glutamate-5-semialdehyde dehydrogenase
MKELMELGKRAQEAKIVLANSSEEQRNQGLRSIASALRENSSSIIAANKKDLLAGEQNGLSTALLDRLMLDQERVEGIAASILEIVSLPDPLHQLLAERMLPNGMSLKKVTVPIGVIAVIYEARPNVTADSAALCLKSGNTVILRGGKEAINSNLAIAQIMRQALEKAGLPADCVNLVTDTSRESATALMRLNAYVDVLIPRGSAALISSVVQNATVAVIETGSGTCHAYVESSADLEMATEIIYNAKTSRPSVCNACECMLIDRQIAAQALPKIAARLAEKQVEIRGDASVCEILPQAVPAQEDDWGKEYNDYIIAAHVVEGIDEAIAFIRRYGTGHSECIITAQKELGQKFVEQVDAAAVYVNASTRFTDGGEFGLGAEIGISTQKLHARGPLGLAELTSAKYCLYGSGQVR